MLRTEFITLRQKALENHFKVTRTFSYADGRSEGVCGDKHSSQESLLGLIIQAQLVWIQFSELVSEAELATDVSVLEGNIDRIFDAKQVGSDQTQHA